MKKKQLIVVILLLYGIVVSMLLAMPHFEISTYEKSLLDRGYMYMSTRWQYLSQCIEAFNNGTIPNITNSSDHSLGLFYFVGMLGSKLGMSEGYEVLSFVQISAAMFLLMIIPLEIYFIRNSFFDALLSPIIIHFIMGSLLYKNKTDVHWASVWVLTICIPLLLQLIERKWDKISWLIFLVICLFMALANIIRGQSSLSVLILLCGSLIKKIFFDDDLKNNLLKFGSSIICILIIFTTYNSLGVNIPEKVCMAKGQPPAIAANTVWHNIYIGFGFEENKYGLRYDDDCLRDIVAEAHPDIEYLSAEYYNICRDLVLELIQKDPRFCLMAFIKKFFLTILVELKYLMTEIYFTIAVILSAVTLLKTKFVLKKNRICLTFVILCFVAWLLGMIQPILAYPDYKYAFPSIGALCCLVSGVSVGVVGYWFNLMIKKYTGE